jgi:hypothetical protein
MAIWIGAAAPYRYGETAIFTIFVAWVVMLAFAGWRAWRQTRLA